MPTTQILGQPPSRWLELAYPVPHSNYGTGTTPDPAYDIAATYGGAGQVNATPTLPTVKVAGASGTGAAQGLVRAGGRFYETLSTTSAAIAYSLDLPWWNPLILPGGAVASGGPWIDPLSVVAVWDIIAQVSGIGGHTPDGTGWFWVPNAGIGSSPSEWYPGGTNCNGGFAVVVNPTANTFDFVAFDPSATILQRSAAPGSPLLTKLQWIRLVVQTGTSSKGARLTLTLNGAAWVDQYFDGATLVDPGAYVAAAINYAWIPMLNRASGTPGLVHSWVMRFGPQTPDGVTVQT